MASPPSPQPDSSSPSPRKNSGRGLSGTQAGVAVLDPASLELALAAFQQRIDQLQQSLAQQNQLATLGMVTAVIAHEFNNILTPMISYTKFALSDKADEALRQKALTKALGGAERLANISKSLLGFARGDETTTAVVITAVKETLGCLARDLSKDGITLTLDIPETLTVAMNAGYLQQVLMNLIVNARSAMVHGACGVKRLTIRGVQKGKWVELTVADTGPGIDPEVLPRIFEPFFSTKRGGDGGGGGVAGGGGEEAVPRGGTGLGLTICRELVTSAGGKIRAIAEKGQGAIFVMDLPLA